jgi:glutamyl-tRNA reductase
VKLYNLDDLQSIADKNKGERQKSAEKAEKIVDEELILLERDVKSQSVRKVISFLLSKAEEVRQRELTKAFTMLQDADEKEKKVIDDLTLILLKQTFIPIVENLRKAAVNGDKEAIEQAIKLFGMEAN